MPRLRPLNLVRRVAATRAIALPAITAAVTLLPAAGAAAGPYEQVSRASGAQGAASFARYTFPLGVSDDGRFALFGDSAPYGAATVRLRDIVTNTTRTVVELPRGTGAIGVDRSQTKLLLQSDDAVAVRDLTSGTERKIATVDAVNDWPVTSALSGDAKTVAVSTPASGVTWYDAETGAVRRHLDDGSLRLNAKSLSDDGTVTAGEGSFTGFWIKGDGAPQSVDGNAIVSPDGSTVVGVGPWPGGDIAVVKTADGTAHSVPAPEASDHPLPVWIAPGGDRVVVAGHAGPDKPAYSIDTTTGAATPFGGAFTGSIRGDLRGPAPLRALINRDGKVALLGYSGVSPFLPTQIAVAKLDGGDLPGAQEPISASSYVAFDYPIAYACETGTPADELRGIVQRPASWLPKPRLAYVRVAIDGRPTLSKTTMKFWDRAVTPYPAADLWLTAPYDAKTTKTITVTAATIDQRGNLATSSETLKPVCSG